jgi:hypothetical protein
MSRCLAGTACTPQREWQLVAVHTVAGPWGAPIHLATQKP